MISKDKMLCLFVFSFWHLIECVGYQFVIFIAIQKKEPTLACLFDRNISNNSNGLTHLASFYQKVNQFLFCKLQNR